MSRSTALLTFGIGPVHELIASARRVADVWAGSDLLSHLMGRAITAARRLGGEPVFPALEEGEEPVGIPNRVVLRVPAEKADEIGRAMGEAVQARWTGLAEAAVDVLSYYGIAPSEALWPGAPDPEHPRQTDRVFDLSWSWVPEEGGYARASAAGARRFAATRLFRPFGQVDHRGEKCALCGLRTALPNGRRGDVRQAWQAAAAKAEDAPLEPGDERFFRYDQGRLCLVCATKRLYTREGDKKVYFQALDRFDRDEGAGEGAAKPKAPRSEDLDRRRYVALVSMDGDRMSEILALGPDAIAGRDVQAFHVAVSRALGRFSRALRRKGSSDPRRRAQLDLDGLGIESRASDEGTWPQLIYAGGDDVLVVCAPADALQVAQAIRQRFLAEVANLCEHLTDPDLLGRLTLSGAIVYAHSKHPAGLLFREADELLKRKAKGEEQRDALAVRLMKRSGVPVEVAFRWAESSEAAESLPWLEAVDLLVRALRDGGLSSSQTFNLRREEEVLVEVFGDDLERWTPWLEDRLSRGEASSDEAKALARGIAPFLAHGKGEALRIVRFLGVEISR